jgi:methylmalonyl-CoA mutase N-terminal domain/subunit
MTEQSNPRLDYPYRGGITTTTYAEQPWIIGQYSGYTSPEQTNLRFRKLIEVGQQGIAVAMDLPTQLGMDPDHPLAAGEVGRVGVSLACVDDMAALFDGIPLSSVRQISTTANSMGAMFAAMILVLAERRGEDPMGFSLRLQNDVLKEYIARGTQIFPVRPGAELSVDVVEYCANHLPHWVPMCVSGYHIRDAGSTREQEVGFTLANAEQYLELATARGVDIGHFAKSMSWFMSASSDVIREAAKFRSCREVWARLLSEKYQVDDPAATKLRVNSYTLGGDLSPYELMNNSVRVTLSALGAVLGGVQSLFCSSIDEAVGLPSDETAALSVQTQRIILRESGLADFLDPLGGSDVVESETDKIVAAARDIAAKVAEQGGSIAAIESGWMRSEIDTASWEQSLRDREQPRVGEPDPNAPTGEAPKVGQLSFAIDPTFETRRREDIAQWRARRPAAQVEGALADLATAATNGGNLMPALIDAFRADLTIGAICQVLIDEFGAFHPSRQRASDAEGRTERPTSERKVS